MTEKTLAIFEGQRIRRHFDEKTETWYFSVVDIVQVLIQQPDFQTAHKYWNKLKERLNKEGSESVTKCNRLKMEAGDSFLPPGSTKKLQTSLPSIEQIEKGLGEGE